MLYFTKLFFKEAIMGKTFALENIVVAVVIGVVVKDTSDNAVCYAGVAM